MRIREIDHQSVAEIDLVASKMRQTLIEVMGEERGGSYYSMDWLRERVRWHLDSRATTARIYLAEDSTGQIVGQAIVRIERDEAAEPFGYFSTLYVEPSSRRQGLATALLNQAEEWVREQGLPKIIYNTAHYNDRLLKLFHRHGFKVTFRETEMVQLTKVLAH